MIDPISGPKSLHTYQDKGLGRQLRVPNGASRAGGGGEGGQAGQPDTSEAVFPFPAP